MVLLTLVKSALGALRRRSASLAPQTADADRHYRRALQQHEAGQQNEALASIAQCLACTPDHGPALLTSAQWLAHEPAEALARYRRAATLLPNLAGEINVNMGILLKPANRTEALHCFRTGARLAPEQAEAHYNLGLALYEMGHIDEAENSLRRALELKPHFPIAHRRAGGPVWIAPH